MSLDGRTERRPRMPNNAGNLKSSCRLAAIVAADVTRDGRLMTTDEEATVGDLKAHQSVIVPMIGERGGRIIDTAVAGVPAEFGSIVKAVDCAIAIHRTMTGRNLSVEEPRRIRVHIGINVGDVIHEGHVYGDGVNIAARLESIAEPGGICISDDAYRQLQGKLSAQFVDGGEQQLKNIPRRVRVYRASPHGTPRMVRPALAIRDKPAIALLPFENMSDAAKDIYLGLRKTSSPSCRAIQIISSSPTIASRDATMSKNPLASARRGFLLRAQRLSRPDQFKFIPYATIVFAALTLAGLHDACAAVDKWMKCTITESPIPANDRYFGFNEADKTVAEYALGRLKSCHMLYITEEWINAWCYPETGGTDWVMIDRIEGKISINRWPFVAHSYRFKDAVGEDKGVCTPSLPPKR
jgi:class 3 adenylate cyclase